VVALKALVTGGAGFIGGQVVRALIGAGHDVAVLHLPTDRLTNLEGLAVETIAGDVTDRACVRAALKGRDWVFHLAAIYALWTRDPERMRTVNVEGTRIVLQEAGDAGVQRVVYTSSIAVFGGQGLRRDATEESPFRLGQTGDVYSLTKYESHRVAQSFAQDGLDVTIVAPTGPVGPGDVGPTPTGRLLLMALNAPVGLAARSSSNVADVRDIAMGHVLAAEHGVRGESYLLGGENVDLATLPTLVYELAGIRHRPVVAVPSRILSVAARGLRAYARVSGVAPPFTPESVRILRLGLRADCRKAVRELGLPQRPLRESVRDALVWFARHGYVSSPKIAARLLALS
jgi:dihydroflavonol-4-reductase